jgi:hypothetical protein
MYVQSQCSVMIVCVRGVTVCDGSYADMNGDGTYMMRGLLVTLMKELKNETKSN